MKKTLAEITGQPADPRSWSASKHLVDSSVLVGLEVETENIPLLEDYEVNPDTDVPYVPFKYWTVKRDGSLKGKYPYEFVLKMPLAGNDLYKAIRELAKFLHFYREDIVLSERASLQVHLDVRSMSLEQLTNLVVLYCTFERLLYRYCGGNRENNIFCVPFWKQNQNLQDICYLMDPHESVETYILTFQSCQKYSGLFIGPIINLGSVEFRMHPATRRTHEILEWVNILLCLHRAARLGIPWKLIEVPAKISSMGFDKFSKGIFGDYLSLLKYPGYNQDVLKGIRIAQDVLYGYEWNKLFSNAKCTAKQSSFGKLYPQAEPKAMSPKPTRKVKKQLFGLNINELPPMDENF